MGQIPWSNTHATVHRQLKGAFPSRPNTALIPAGAPCLVAVSGGQDSVCLLKLLVDLQAKWHWRLQAVHCDHRWRPDSAANAAFVQDLCHRWGVPIQVVTAPVPPRSEADARQWRYQVFAAVAAASQATYVATGHTATDRAETLLYNLLRGSGVRGLQALAEQRSLLPDQTEPEQTAIAVVRPILSLTRQQTADFCQRFDLPVWLDTTNQDCRYARNRIRLELVPYLQQHFNPNLEITLAQTADLVTADLALLEHLSQQLYQQTVEPGDEGQSWRIQRSPLQTAHLALQRRVLRQVLQQVVSAEVGFSHSEKLVGLLHAPQGHQSDPFPGGWLAQVRGDQIVLFQPDS
jgi:tRNA(Ile)-lysidine synthase